MIRVAILWHMHQPFYKDLATGVYRMPWVRLHALKDYYGMVRLAEEFPAVHQTFNLVPSLVTQLQDYAEGRASDPLFDVAAKPAGELTGDERRLALQYLFQANQTHLIGRYPRYAELLEHFHAAGSAPERAEQQFSEQDFTDLQVLSQLAWFDEYWLEEPEFAALASKGRGYDVDDQKLVTLRQRELVAQVLPEYRKAAESGTIEISASPFYHPILPLVCDTDVGAVSAPGLPLPKERFQHPEDAREQLQRGLELHEGVFGKRPRGVWPSEGSLSEEVLALAHSLGVAWMASDEGVLGRSLGISFARNEHGILPPEQAERLYRVYRYEKAGTQMHLLFRDHSISDLIGFVYGGMEAKDAAAHLVQRIRDCAQPLVQRGLEPVVPIILDGENAWEYYPKSGREFLRRFYAVLSKEEDLRGVTFSEAIAGQREFAELPSLQPGSWINANFNVWIGSEEDNRSWEHLDAAREFYAENSGAAAEQQRELAWEELLIAEGSDWNWWYGPEHHSANDAEFDALYRQHLSNVYSALGAVPPEALAQPIAHGIERPFFVPQTAYIHPRISSAAPHYFDWVGAAMYSAERSGAAMHGRQFYLEAVHAGIDEANLYVRVELAKVPESEFEMLFAAEALPPGSTTAARGPAHLRVAIANGEVTGWSVESGAAGQNGGGQQPAGVAAGFRAGVEVLAPLELLGAERGGKIRLRVSLWRNGLPLDALPLEGSMELDVLSEQDLSATGY